MAKWTISEYTHLPRDPSGNAMMIGRPARQSQGVAAAGQVNLLTGTGFVRFCGDTAAHVAVGTTVTHQATTNDEYVAAGVDYWVAVDGATAINFIAG